MIIEDFENREALTKLVQVTCEALMQQPQKKRRSSIKNKEAKKEALSDADKADLKQFYLDHKM